MRLAAARMRRGVDHLHPGDALSDVLRQRFVRQIHVEKIGRAAPHGPWGRNFDRTQQARRRRHFDKRAVGVPERFAITEPADRLSIFDDVRDDRYFRRYLATTAFIFGLDAILLFDQCRGREFELPELASEGEMLFVGHRLPAKPQHEMIEPGTPDRIALKWGERTANIDPTHIGAEP